MDLGAVSRGDCNDFCTPATHLWVPQYKVGGTVHSYCIKDACCNDFASAAVTRHWVRQYKAGGMDHILTVQSGWDGPHSYSTKWVGRPTLTVQSGWGSPHSYSTKVAKAAYLSTMVKRFPDSSPNRNCFSTYLLTTKRFHHISVDNQTFPSYIC